MIFQPIRIEIVCFHNLAFCLLNCSTLRIPPAHHILLIIVVPVFDWQASLVGASIAQPSHNQARQTPLLTASSNRILSYITSLKGFPAVCRAIPFGPPHDDPSGYRMFVINQTSPSRDAADEWRDRILYSLSPDGQP
jgi:hypothetical protein